MQSADSILPYKKLDAFFQYLGCRFVILGIWDTCFQHLRRVHLRYYGSEMPIKGISDASAYGTLKKGVLDTLNYKTASWILEKGILDPRKFLKARPQI